MICLYIGGARVEDRKKNATKTATTTIPIDPEKHLRRVMCYIPILYRYIIFTHTARIRSDFIWIYRQAVYYFDYIILYTYIYDDDDNTRIYNIIYIKTSRVLHRTVFRFFFSHTQAVQVYLYVGSYTIDFYNNISYRLQCSQRVAI